MYMLLAKIAINTYDLVIIVTYLIGIMALGIWVGYRKKTSSTQFFLAGRSLKWPMIGAALFTANISTIHLVGLSASGFSEGIVVGNFEWMASFCLIVLGLVFVPFYLRTKITTLPEFLEKRYSKTCRMITALIAIWSALLVHIGVSLYAGAKVFDYFFGIPVIYSIIIIAVVTAVYTILGGLKAIVVTDTIQAVLLLGGCVLLTFFALSKLPSAGIHSFADLKGAVKTDQLSMAHSLRDANGNFNQYSWLTLMIGYHVLGIWYWCTDQTIVQKTLGAKDMRNGQLGAVFAGCLKILPLFFMVLPGVVAYVLFRDKIGDPNDTLTVMIDELLPTGLKGLFAAGLLAAVMSTVEAALNSTATVTAEDIVRHIRPQTKDGTLVLIGRITACAVIVLAMLWSPFCGRFENIFVVINQVPMMFAPAITTVFVLGAFWRRGTKQAAVATFATGVVIGLIYFVSDLPHDVSAADVIPAITAKRVANDRVVEPWAAIPKAEKQTLLAEGISADVLQEDWGKIPYSVEKAVIKANQWRRQDDAKQKVADAYLAAPVRNLQPVSDANVLATDTFIRTNGSVPEAELTAALATGALLSNWKVANYGRVTHGIGIPFMMMGLILLAMCIIVYVIVSLNTPAPTVEELKEMGWQSPLRSITSTKITGITDPRVVAGLLFVVMIILYCVIG